VKFIWTVLLMAITTPMAHAAMLPSPLVVQVPAVTEQRYDWNCVRPGGEENPRLVARGCRTEWVPLSILVMCPGELHNLNVTVELDNFKSDVRWVKWTWVSGQYYQDNQHTAWAPLWLVHDFDLVEVDRTTPGPVKHKPLVEDPPTLKPMHVPPEYLGYNQQVWIDVQVPKGAASGEHFGNVTITSDETPAVEIPLKFYVWPFDLVKPRIIYSVCYRATIQIPDDAPMISDLLKTPTQAKADFVDMVRHGVTTPISYEPCGRGMSIPFGLQRAAGMDLSTYVTCGGYPGMDDYAEYNAQWGVKDIYVYGPNENSKDSDWAALRATWRESKRQGAKVWGWMNFNGWLDYVGNDIDLPVTNWAPGMDIPAVVKEAHRRGMKIWSYGQPQTGNLHPLDYRRNDGVRLWAFGFDGVAPYSYQHTFPDVMPDGSLPDAWDDFATKTYREKVDPNNIYRSHNFTYPAKTGPVGTLSWEGYAAATVDTRYLTTLEACPQTPKVKEFLERVKAEADTIDLDGMRQEAARLIAEVQ
jgi:hypothetical protein